MLARWTEEVSLLEEEMRRTIRFFKYWQRQWMGYADTDELEGKDSSAAYSRK